MVSSGRGARRRVRRASWLWAAKMNCVVSSGEDEAAVMRLGAAMWLAAAMWAPRTASSASWDRGAKCAPRGFGSSAFVWNSSSIASPIRQ